MRKAANITGAVVLAAGVLVPVVLACGGVHTSSEGGVNKADDFVAGQLVVTFAEGTAPADIDAAVAAAGAELLERSAVTPTRVVVAVPEGEEEEYAAAFREMDTVRSAEKNYIMKAFGVGGAAN